MCTVPGETVTGDRHVVREDEHGIVLAVIDGLGHGKGAAHAAALAASVVETVKSEDPVEIVSECHRALIASRGVVMTVLSLNPANNVLSCLAVGNVLAMIVRKGPNPYMPLRDFVVLRGGVVGHMLPPLHSSYLKLEVGDTLILATDGVRIDFTTDRGLRQPPQLLADRILANYAGGSDDALVLAARYTAGATS